MAVRRHRWPLIYFALAGLDILTVLASVYLGERLLSTHLASLEMSRDMARLRASATALNAPGNDIFDSHDPARERARLEALLPAFGEALDRVRAATSPEHAASIEQAMTAMTDEAQAVLNLAAAGDYTAAGRRMASMDRASVRLAGAIARVEASELDVEYAGAWSARRLAIYLVMLVACMVGGAVLYGRRLHLRMQEYDEAQERSLDQMRHARDEAERTARAKADFLANMSHEIRTPMNGVLGMAELLMSTPLTDEQREFAGTIHRSGDHLLALINDVLDFSKMEAGKLRLDETDFTLRPLMHDIVALFRERVTAKGIELRLEIAAEVPDAMRGDPHRLRQILTNLVGNAVKFTDAGHVEVRVSREDPDPPGAIAVRVDVRDTGIGIAPDAGARLFAPFEQVDGSLTRRFGGTGLGLVISRRLCELMHGTIGFDSTPGTGSHFWFVVHLRPGTALPNASLPATEAAVPDDDRQARQRGLHVLVVDDTPVNITVVRNMLVRLGHQVDHATSGVAALEAMGSRAYDLVLMDCQMPDVDGFEATRRHRRRETPPERMPIIALTAQALQGDREQCLAAGMDDYLTKPVRTADLRRMLERWTTGRVPRSGAA